MKKICYSFGCSYTQFAWPTWANFIGSQFDEHISYAKSGAGNRYIFLSVIDALQKHNITEEDILLIQWSSLCREDRIVPNENSFKTPGNLDYQTEYPKCFADKVFNPLQQVVELESYVYILRELFKSKNITYRMTNMYEPYLGRFLGEPVISEINTKFYRFLVKEGALRRLKNLMSEGFLTSIESYIPQRDCYFYIKYGSHLEIQTDDHPTVKQHLAYAKYVYHDIFGDYGNLESEQINEQIIYFTNLFTNKEEVTRLCDEDKMHLLTFPEEIFNKKLTRKSI